MISQKNRDPFIKVDYFHRYSKETRTERNPNKWGLINAVTGFWGAPLRFSMKYWPWFSYLIGWNASRPSSAKHIPQFIENNQVDPETIAQPISSYPTLNAFFTRSIDPARRPIAQGEHIAAFPADGRHLAFQDLSEVDQIYVKGQSFDLPQLFNNSEIASYYRSGSLLISRLCAADCHRYTFPVSGEWKHSELIKGSLFPVHAYVVAQRINYLFSNKRIVNFIHSPLWGQVALLEIGATNVGSIQHTAPLGIVAKGQEMGYFNFGGSCLITLWPKGRIQFDDDLLHNSASGVETFAHYGDHCGTWIKP